MAALWARLGRLLLIWTLVTTLGGAMAYGLFLGLASLSFSPPELAAGLRLALAGAFSGALTGRLQVWALSGSWAPEGWAPATAVGWLVALPLAVGLSTWLAPRLSAFPDSYRLAGGLAAAALAGVAGSLLQWRIVHARLRYAGWWPVANGVGWLMAWVLVLSVGLFLGSGQPLPAGLDRLGDGLLLGATAGFVIGVEQGIALVGLVAQQAWES